MEHNTLLAINIIARCAAAAVALCSAGWLAYHGKDGWGWFLFIALLLGSISVSYSEGK